MSNLDFLWTVYLGCVPVSIILTLIAVVALFMFVKDLVKKKGLR